MLFVSLFFVVCNGMKKIWVLDKIEEINGFESKMEKRREKLLENSCSRIVPSCALFKSIMCTMSIVYTIKIFLTVDERDITFLTIGTTMLHCVHDHSHRVHYGSAIGVYKSSCRPICFSTLVTFYYIPLPNWAFYANSFILKFYFHFRFAMS